MIFVKFGCSTKSSEDGYGADAADFLLGNDKETYLNIKLFSVLSSMLSLTWSFSKYEAIQQKGALSFGINPVGRILLTISTFFQVSIVFDAFNWQI